MLGGTNKQQKKSMGYTLIEVLIVLAVSGMMFVIAANFINGKQEKTAFTQGVNEMASRIQDAVSQVSDGNYSDIPFVCNPSGGGSLSIASTGTPSGDTQGTNPNCVFVGKFFHFVVGGNPNNYEVFSLAALRTSTSLGSDVTPVVSSDGVVDLTQKQTIPQGLTVNWVHINGSGATRYGFGFTQSQGSLDDSGNYTNGAQTVQLVYSPTLGSGSESSAVSQLQGHVAQAKSAKLCLTDGSQNAEITVGNTTNGSQVAVAVTMRGTASCQN